jgi:hypothetical protein
LDLSSQLFRIAGVDLTKIDGIQVQTAQTVISEVGVDMSRWKTEKQFASWLGLCPDNRISGGKVLKRGTRHVVNRAATALRMAAWSLFRSQSALGANFRRLRRKLGAPKAITAMAHKLARLVYRMLKFGQGYLTASAPRPAARLQVEPSITRQLLSFPQITWANISLPISAVGGFDGMIPPQARLSHSRPVSPPEWST